MEVSLQVPVRGAGAKVVTVPTIEESLQAWEMDGKKPRPEIITAAWQGTELDERLLDLWGWLYASLYSWMLALRVTGDLWEAFEDLACQFLAGSNLILDAGTGTGRTPTALLNASSTVRIIAADWSEHFLRQARNNLGMMSYCERVALWRIDLAQQPWPWPDDSFGGATAHCVLSHLPRFVQIIVLREIHRVLQPGSIFLVDYMREGSSHGDIVRHNVPTELREHPWVLLRALLAVPAFTKKADRVRAAGLIYDFSDAEFCAVVREIGYRDAEIVGEGFEGSGGPAVPFWKLTK